MGHLGRETWSLSKVSKGKNLCHCPVEGFIHNFIERKIWLVFRGGTMALFQRPHVSEGPRLCGKLLIFLPVRGFCPFISIQDDFYFVTVENARFVAKYI